jgi:hypothetical protein
VLGRGDLASRWTATGDDFERDLGASLEATITRHGIDYIPGSAELADFDPTATTIALDPAGQMERLPPRQLTGTFQRYYDEFIQRRDGRRQWDAYTPYEIRTVGSFVRLGWRDRIPELLKFFFQGRRPAEWNAWAEVVGRDERKPRFIGDLPHAWVGADYIRSFLDLFAYERPSDKTIVLAAGIPSDWLSTGHAVGIQNLRMPHGLLTYSLRADSEGAVHFWISDGLQLPPGGLVLAPPLPHTPRRVKWNGKTMPFQGAELVIRSLPADVTFVMEE